MKTNLMMLCALVMWSCGGGEYRNYNTGLRNQLDFKNSVVSSFDVAVGTPLIVTVTHEPDGLFRCQSTAGFLGTGGGEACQPLDPLATVTELLSAFCDDGSDAGIAGGPATCTAEIASANTLVVTALRAGKTTLLVRARLSDGSVREDGVWLNAN